jgi:hypothetical protein
MLFYFFNALAHVDLNSNRLIGQVPSEIGLLTKLSEYRFAVELPLLIQCLSSVFVFLIMFQLCSLVRPWSQ